MKPAVNQFASIQPALERAAEGLGWIKSGKVQTEQMFSGSVPQSRRNAFMSTPPWRVLTEGNENHLAFVPDPFPAVEKIAYFV